MTDTIQFPKKPGIIVSDADQRRLTTLATTALDRAPAVAEELLNEIGLSEGQSISWMTRDGHRRSMTVVKVEGTIDTLPPTDDTDPGPAAA